MFGYVTIDKPELKVKEFDIYHAYYCGLCHRLHALYGLRGQMTLSYDLTFLVMLLTGLYEPAETQGKIRCAVHPLAAHPAVVNRFTDYAAAMNVLLAYHKALDEKHDEHSFKGIALAKALEGPANRIQRMYPKKAAVIKSRMQALRTAEEEGATDLDLVSGIFGELMAAVFTVKDDMFTSAMRNMGFFLGKYLYLLDAYDDLDDDMKKGAYNPLILLLRTRSDFDAYVKDLLTMMISEAAGAFEFLPIIKNVTILKNILYAGVWSKYHDRSV